MARHPDGAPMEDHTDIGVQLMQFGVGGDGHDGVYWQAQIPTYLRSCDPFN